MNDKQKKELIKICSAVILFLVMMTAEKTGMLPALFGDRKISFVLYLIPYLLCGYPVVRKAFLGIRNRQPLDECFLMFIATIGAFATGENSEAVAVMAFYQVGEWFQGYAVGKSRQSISDLMDIVPEFANVEQEDGSFETVDPDDVCPGDILVIRPGEKIPVDSVVLSGESLINTSALTGEPVPRTVREGDDVISGCVNGEGLLRVRAIKEFEDSTVSRILELVENASEKKSRTEAFITRFARVYTPIVVGLAVMLAILPPLMFGGWMTWIYRACTFLVISCPCALVISVPLAFFGGIGAASKSGVLVKGSNYLELLAHLDTVVSDKTGTLTEGSFTVTDLRPADGVTPEDLLRTAAIAESLSVHPIAHSILSEYESRFGKTRPLSERPSDSENVSGKGITAKHGDRKILVGSRKFMEDQGILPENIEDPAATIVFVAEDDRYLGAVLIRDRIKKSAPEAIRGLKKAGVRSIVMLTGDRREAADAVGRELGVDSVRAELLPQDKVREVETMLTELQKNGDTAGRGRLAFIGDGINDAPVLTRADVGIAMGSMGSDAAIEAADVVIMDDNLSRIPGVIGIAKKTAAVSTQNIVFAITVKVLILILGAAGIANMWAAVFADVGVAVLCILNSMRLLKTYRSITV
ncbi:MAG: heavy metal translocating P-type ATPase [Bacillota bacterium]|nr:heavy metal translocating P-type ATPase [Bacillota bacterium]